MENRRENDLSEIEDQKPVTIIELGGRGRETAENKKFSNKRI